MHRFWLSLPIESASAPVVLVVGFFGGRVIFLLLCCSFAAIISITFYSPSVIESSIGKDKWLLMTMMITFERDMCSSPHFDFTLIRLFGHSSLSSSPTTNSKLSI